MTSSTLPPDAQKKSVKYWEKMGDLNLLMGTLTAADHKRTLKEQAKNREAESAAVRKHAWGASDEMGEEELGDQIVLGDIRTEHHHAAPPAPSATSNIAKTLAAAGLAAAGLGAGAALPIAAYQMFKQAPNVIVPTDTDTDTNTKYGLRVFRDAEQQQE